MSATNFNPLSVRYLTAEGYKVVEVVEHYDYFKKRRNDLFGIFDILALKGAETLAVQATSASNVMARVHKIAESPNIGPVREAGWTVKVHGWRKRGGRWELHRDIDLS